VLPFAHRDSSALGGRLAFLGPVSASGAALFLAWRIVARLRRSRGESTRPDALEKQEKAP
jgi:hypothetical protein